jgi:hypothetical protein
MFTSVLFFIGIAPFVIGACYCIIEKHIITKAKTLAEIRVLTAQGRAFELQVEQAVKNVAKQAEQEAAMAKAVAERDARAVAIKAKQVANAAITDVKEVVTDIKKEL